MTNPPARVKGNPGAGREAYIEDAAYQVEGAAAEEPLQDAMDLAYLTGQRPADVLKLSSTDVQAGELAVVQKRPGTAYPLPLGELATVIQRIRARKVAGMTLIARQGKVMTKAALRGVRSSPGCGNPCLSRHGGQDPRISVPRSACKGRR